MKSFKELIVWQKSLALVIYIYKISQQFPKHEVYGLSSQIKRAAVSIPSNIAEGSKRSSVKDYVRFLYIAQGSAAELETQIEISFKLNYIDMSIYKAVLLKLKEVQKMLNSLIKKLNTYNL